MGTIITPYGGRLEWQTPGGNKLVVHLKDKDQIRHRKRWSQVMYMYGLLAYPFFGKTAQNVLGENESIDENESTGTNSILNNTLDKSTEKKELDLNDALQIEPGQKWNQAKNKRVEQLKDVGDF